MLDKALKARWIAALKSGKYRKGSGQLRSLDNKYCCLGVAADLLVQDGKARWTTHGSAPLISSAKVDSSGGYIYLPEDLAVEIGLTRQQQNKLARINDRDTTFQPAIKAISKL